MRKVWPTPFPIPSIQTPALPSPDSSFRFRELFGSCRHFAHIIDNLSTEDGKMCLWVVYCLCPVDILLTGGVERKSQTYIIITLRFLLHYYYDIYFAYIIITAYILLTILLRYTFYYNYLTNKSYITNLLQNRHILQTYYKLHFHIIILTIYYNYSLYIIIYM
jgi:hypothetical protein